MNKRVNVDILSSFILSLILHPFLYPAATVFAFSIASSIVPTM